MAVPFHIGQSRPPCMDQKRETGRKPGGPLLPRIRKSEWTIGTPDAIFSLHGNPGRATGQMPYVYLRVKTNFPEDRWIQATEVRPTAPEVVHHVLVFASGADGIKREQAGALAAYVPGNTFVEFPPGVAKKLPAGATLLFQMHYTPTESDYRPDANRTPLRKNPSCQNRSNTRRQSSYQHTSPCPRSLKPLRNPFLASSCGPYPTYLRGSSTTAYADGKTLLEVQLRFQLATATS